MLQRFHFFYSPSYLYLIYVRFECLSACSAYNVTYKQHIICHKSYFVLYYHILHLFSFSSFNGCVLRIKKQAYFYEKLFFIDVCSFYVRLTQLCFWYAEYMLNQIVRLCINCLGMLGFVLFQKKLVFICCPCHLTTKEVLFVFWYLLLINASFVIILFHSSTYLVFVLNDILIFLSKLPHMVVNHYFIKVSMVYQLDYSKFLNQIQF